MVDTESGYMDCPRCDGSVERYELGDNDSMVCQQCGYVGVEADHEGETIGIESWAEALRRFRDQ